MKERRHRLKEIRANVLEKKLRELEKINQLKEKKKRRSEPGEITPHSKKAQ